MTTEKKEAANTIFCARSLGEGKIVRLLKRYAFIDDQRLGKIYAPLEACQSFFPNANDLRDVFKENDLVVFTAHRQTEKTNNDCKYVASSVVQKDRLFNCYGKVTEVSEKYAYAEAPKYGRIFLPFSARNEQNRPWLGRGAIIGKKVYLRIMPQPEVNKCAHVAYGVSLNYPENSALTNGYEYETMNSSSLSDSAKFSIGGRIERQPDAVSEQLGIFIKHIDNDVLIYAPQTGLVNVPNSLLNSISSGNFVHFDALKSISKQREKCTWSAKKVEPIGNLVKILPDFPSRFIPFNEDRLTIEVDAVVCRVSNANSSAWLWNDLVGRIFVNNHVYLGGLRALDVVHVKAQFTAAFEDVPWSAVEIDFIGDDVEKRSEIAQLLVTDDRWEVLYVSEQASGTFFGFMENEALGSAFMAWTDLTEGESPPAKGDICRVTAYRQNRDRKHEWRALLVTPIDQNKNEPIFYHPYVKTTGQLDENIINEVRRMKATRRPPMEKKIVPSAIMSSIESSRDSNDVAPPGFEPTPIGSTRIRSTASSDVSSDNAFDVEQSYLSYHKDSNHHPLLSFPLNENRSSTESMNTPDIGTRSIFDAWVSPNERLLPDWKFESPFENLRSESMNISEENHRPRSGASSVPPNNNANTNGSNTYDSFNSPFITPVAEKFQRQQLSERRQEQSNLPRYMPQPLGLFNGVAGLGQPPSLFPVTPTNGHPGAISSDAAIQTDADSDSYENFLLGEIRKRPKLLCRIISEDLGADIYQILLDLMKRKGSNR